MHRAQILAQQVLKQPPAVNRAARGSDPTQMGGADYLILGRIDHTRALASDRCERSVGTGRGPPPSLQEAAAFSWPAWLA